MKQIIEIVIASSTTDMLYTELNNFHNKIFDPLFASFGICIDKNKNNKCSTDEVDNGLSAWNVKILPSGYTYEYKYPPGRN